MTPTLLIIFYRNPELGKVKTRLAATVGQENALSIYLKLAAYTQSVTIDLLCDKAVFYSHRVEADDIWNDNRYQKVLQNGDDLGERMSNALHWAFQKGYESACIIGTDCMEITTELIEDSFDELALQDVVVGAAKDGGYYLIGMHQLHKKIFENKPWSSYLLMGDTLETLEELKLAYELMPVLNDVDTEEDLPAELKAELVKSQ